MGFKLPSSPLSMGRSESADASRDDAIEGIAVASSPDDAEVLHKILTETGLLSDHSTTNVCVLFLGKGKVRVPYVTARGVQAIGRRLCASVEYPGAPAISYTDGRPVLVVVKARVVSKNGFIAEELGVVTVQPGELAIAIKKAATNASARAIRMATGLSVPDETLAEELTR